MRTIAIHTSKGGVGKTTLTVNISYELAKRGYRVLVIDLDDQANTSLYLGVNKADEFNKAKNLDEVSKILYSFEKRKEVIDFLKEDFDSPDFDCRQYIKEDSPFNEFIIRSGFTGKIDILPSSYRTKMDDQLMQTAGGGAIKQSRLNRVLQKPEIANAYDYVIIDTPPSQTMVGINGLYAARYLVIPSQMEYFSVFGVISVIMNIKKTVHVDMEQRSKILGVVPMMTDSSKASRLSKQLLQQMLPSDIEILPDIKRTTYFATAVKDRLPISAFAEKKPKEGGPAAMQLATLTDKLISRIDQEENTQGLKMANKIESGHGLLFLSQIMVPTKESNTSRTKTNRLLETFEKWGFNFVFPVVCLSDEEEKYRLLTGLPLYEAAKEAKLKQIWVFLVAVHQEEAEKVIEEVQFQASFNERLIESEDLEEFRKFLNDEESMLTSIPGIKDGYAKFDKK
ncbi:MAG: AAA family ATPase [Leptolyngbyaceae cyanobacterium SL_5_14]|nr:AAA family ATPase [Leptolyngbyaceae cyanobacterium SL_5_14]